MEGAYDANKLFTGNQQITSRNQKTVPFASPHSLQVLHACSRMKQAMVETMHRGPDNELRENSAKLHSIHNPITC